MRGAALIALALTILVMPFGAGFPLTDDPYPHYRAVPWLDIASAALVLAAIPILVRRIRAHRMAAGAALWAAICVLLALSLAVHPSAIGAQTLLRALAILATAIVMRELDAGQRGLILGAIGVVATGELVLAVVQVATGGPTDVLGVAPGLSPIRINVMVARGTFLNEYVYAGFGLVAAGLFVWHGLAERRGPPWLGLGAVAIAAVGMSFSRGALAGYLGGAAALAVGARSSSRHRWALAALLVGGLVPLLALSDGWVRRAEESVGGGPSQQAVAERALLDSQALVLIREHPLTGIGTGQYVAAARARFPDEPATHAVHNVPLILAAEAGVPAGLLALALGLVLAVRAMRSGPAAVALYVMLVPALLVDVYPYVSAQGTVLTGLWIGGLDAAREIGSRAATAPAPTG